MTKATIKVASASDGYFFVDLLGFKSGLLLGVSLLSRRRLSTSPVDLAIGFGPGLSAIRSLLDTNVDLGCCRVILLTRTDTFNRHEMLDFSYVKYDRELFCELAYDDGLWPRIVRNFPTDAATLSPTSEGEELPHHALLDARIIAGMFAPVC